MVTCLPDVRVRVTMVLLRGIITCVEGEHTAPSHKHHLLLDEGGEHPTDEEWGVGYGPEAHHRLLLIVGEAAFAILLLRYSSWTQRLPKGSMSQSA